MSKVIDKRIEKVPNEEGVYLKLVLQDDEERTREIIVGPDTYQNAQIGQPWR